MLSNHETESSITYGNHSVKQKSIQQGIQKYSTPGWVIYGIHVVQPIHATRSNIQHRKTEGIRKIRRQELV